jgi:copper(I)-binding protein
MFKKATLALAFLVATTFMTEAHEFKAGDLVIGHPWSRATPGGAKIGGGYLTITNNGSAPDRLMAATAASVADHVEIHEMATKDGVMTMRYQPNGVAIEPGKTVAFSPGSYHLMLMGRKAPRKEGDRIKTVLTVEKAGTVEITINVEGMGAQHPAAGAEDHSKHKM